MNTTESLKYCYTNNIIVMPIDKKNVRNMEEKLDETSLNIIVSFFPRAKGLTIKEIQKNSRYSYEPVYRKLNELVEKKLITSTKIGKTLVYSLNTENWYSKLAYYHYAAIRTRNFLKKYPKIQLGLEQLPQDKLDLVIVFGSYSRGSQTEKSDIDLIIVTPYQKEVESAIQHSKHMYALDFQEITMPRTEFAKIKNENKELWNSLITDGIIIKGADIFYEQAYYGK